MGVIVQVLPKPDSYFSNVFLTEKKDKSFRMILNLKTLNKHINYVHFKMESMMDVLHMITPGSYMASIDLTNAYYSIPVHKDHQKFRLEGDCFEFTCLPNGYAQAPLIFTKILKQVFSLRAQGFESVVYIDDSFLHGESYDSCKQNVSATKALLQKLGFFINFRKSELTPTQVIEFLGFVTNSLTMTIYPTDKKKGKIFTSCVALLEGTTFKIRKIASTLGCIIAVLPGVMHGKMHYRFIEQDKNLALKLANRDFEQTMQLSRSSLSDLLWWRENINHATNVIYHLRVELTLYSDASLEGWRGTGMSHSVGGRWSPEEEISHINVLELYTAKLVLQSLAKRLNTCHIKLLLDNTTTISYVNRMGGTHSPQLNSLAREIWFWAIERKIWLSAAHIPGCENAIADFKSRNFKDNTEWTLGKAIFGKIFNLFQPQLDLFASRLNSQLKTYVSWHPEPDSWAVDAFSLNWNTLKFYAFPPFSLLGRTLSKIRQDQAEGILVAPLWSTQPWFPLLMKLVMEDPLIIFPHKRNLLLPPNFQEAHPLFKHLKLLVIHVSGRPSENSTYLQKLLPSSMTLGDREPGRSTILLSENGNNIVFKGKLIPLIRL